MTQPLQLLIPAAGKGSRFADVGFQTPKPLIPMWGIPMLIWVLNNFPLAQEMRSQFFVNRTTIFQTSSSHLPLG